jgi:hypothetical protein
MRGKDEQQLDVFRYISPEQRVPQDHPLRTLRVMTDEVLHQLRPRFKVALVGKSICRILRTRCAYDAPQQGHCI